MGARSLFESNRLKHRRHTITGSDTRQESSYSQPLKIMPNNNIEVAGKWSAKNKQQPHRMCVYISFAATQMLGAHGMHGHSSRCWIKHKHLGPSSSVSVAIAHTEMMCGQNGMEYYSDYYLLLLFIIWLRAGIFIVVRSHKTEWRWVFHSVGLLSSLDQGQGKLVTHIQRTNSSCALSHEMFNALDVRYQYYCLCSLNANLIFFFTNCCFRQNSTVNQIYCTVSACMQS